jgi:hypothetical protein
VYLNLNESVEVTFKARTFGTSEGEETRDFGDGSPRATTKSNQDVQVHAKDGYAVLGHRFSRASDYLVRVERKDAHQQPAIGYMHVPMAAK